MIEAILIPVDAIAAVLLVCSPIINSVINSGAEKGDKSSSTYMANDSLDYLGS